MWLRMDIIKKEAIRIFDFTDYRAFLKAVYEAGRKQARQLSHRTLCLKLGFTSPNYLKLVMDGERNLSDEACKKIAAGLRMGKKEKEYFITLVHLNQTKSPEEKNRLMGQLAAFSPGTDIGRITVDQFKYYSDWYNVVLRELISGVPASVDNAQLAAALVPSVLPKQIKKALRLLKELKFIRVAENGNYAVESPLISTDKEIQSVAVRNFHRKMIELAGNAIDKVDKEDREISSVTMKISRNGFERIKSRIQEFKDEIIRMVSEDTDVDQVHQLNFQFFPVSRKGRT
jgi:uncharacterized protein (TIGR02147 family)